MLRRCLFVAFCLTLAWAVLVGVLDALALWVVGVECTISWQLLKLSRDNVVIPALLGFVTVGVSVHLFRARDLPLDDARQPLFWWIAGAAAGGALAWATWTQRGPSP